MNESGISMCHRRVIAAANMTPYTNFVASLSSLVLVSLLTQQTVLACECGIENISTRIVNGTRVKDDQFPWIVYIQTDMGHGQAAACTGSLISDRFVMTAAHCVFKGTDKDQDPDKVKVFRGPSCLSKLMDGKYVTSVVAIHKNSEYKDTADSKGDIALLELKDPVKFTDTVRPLCLPNYKQYDNFLAAGYGRTNFGFLLIASKCLKEAPLEMVDQSECNRMGTFDTSKSICVGGGKAAACNGDSGGALMTRRDGRVYAAGIASTASLDCGAITSLPNVYERTWRHISWIREKTYGSKWCNAPYQAIRE